MESYKKDFIEFMVNSGVLTFGDFVTKSGRRTPYFVNTGNYVTGAQMQKLGWFYAKCIESNIPKKIDALFGPAYKGIPLSVSAATAMYTDFGRNLNFCFNRKEAKDHGEGGKMVGYKLNDGDNVIIVEDVVTAGTSVKESIPLLKSQADINILALIVSVDRMEKGSGDRTAIQELYEEFGIKTYPIVTVREITDFVYNHPINGTVYIDDKIKTRMENYFEKYCVK